MSEFTAIIRRDGQPVDIGGLTSCINPLGTFSCVERYSTDTWFGVSYPKNAPLSGSRLVEEGRHVALLAGDLVFDREVDHVLNLLASVKNCENHATLRTLQGAFALAIFDKVDRKLRVVTDTFGLQPVYVHESARGLCTSTKLATFFRHANRHLDIDERWIWEYLFFNYPASDRTLLRGVRLLPPSSVFEYDLRTGKSSLRRYRDSLARRPLNLTRAREIEAARERFRAIIPKYFAVDGQVAFGLSAGLDSRAILAALPADNLASVDAFTYGIPDSTEQTVAAEVADAVAMPHRMLYLDQDSVCKLPGLMHETVYLSDAAQIVNRSHLPYVYGALGNENGPVSAIVTGVSGDHLFRDHITAWGNVPYLISADVAAMHRDGRRRMDHDFYRELFVSGIPEIELHIETVLDSIENDYGVFHDPEAYFRYLMYVAGPRYFGGQAAIANSFSTFRTPYWDVELVEFSMNIELGTVGLSQATPTKDKFRETILQASIVASNPKLSRVPYLNLPIDVFTRRSRINYNVQRVRRRLRSMLFGTRHVSEEDWPLWYRTILAEEIQSLFGAGCLIREYVRPKFIACQIAANDIHWLGKLITLEIALRLAADGWKRPVSRQAQS